MNSIHNKSANEILSLNYTLPIISIPSNKVISFLEWFDTDIYNVAKGGIREIPKIYDEGYIVVTHIPHIFDDQEKSNFIKSVAKSAKDTYRNVERDVNSIYDDFLNNIIIYYKFEGDLPNMTFYGKNGEEKLGGIPLGKPEVKQVVEKDGIALQSVYKVVDSKYLGILGDIDCTVEDGYKFQNNMIEYYFKLLVSAFWYMTLYKNRYKYETVLTDRQQVQNIIYTNTKPTKHNNMKVLTTSFYDLGKAPNSKVETLIKKRAGFEYSHQFDVRGHYRHYKSGKVVFIESYTKAKDKPKLQQYTVLKPVD